MPHSKISHRIQSLDSAGFSLEFFTPDTSEGVDDLRSRILRLAPTEPLFLDILGVGGINEARRALRVCRYAKKVVGLPAMLHVSAAEMTVDQIRTLLAEAKEAGVTNILAERGAPLPDANGSGDSGLLLIEQVAERPRFRALPGGFHHTAELVAFIQREFNGYFCVGVMGYPPSGRGEYASYEEDLAQLRAKQDAGAQFVLVQHVLEAHDFIRFRDDAASIGVALPLIPSVLTVQNFDSFVQANAYCGVPVPMRLEVALRQASGDLKQCRAIGLSFTTELVQALHKAGAQIVHIHTFNLEVVLRDLLRQLGLGAGARRRLPWRPSGDEHRATEDVRPIFWANRPESYLERTASWSQFPSGRWSGPGTEQRAFEPPPSSSLTLGEGGWMTSGPRAGISAEERRAWWGENPASPQDVWEAFARYLEGRVPRLPWCDTPLALETGTISSQLVRLNRSGFLTINSQPRVNAAASDDPVYGWGGKGGYVYQKAYVECFCAPGHLAALMEAVTSGFPSITYHAVDARGNTYSNCKTRGVQAVTWGVFPGREIMQPTVVDPEAFLAWKTEAFGLWLSQWATAYDDDSSAADLIHEVHDTYFLVNLVDNDFMAGDIFKVFEAALLLLPPSPPLEGEAAIRPSSSLPASAATGGASSGAVSVSVSARPLGASGVERLHADVSLQMPKA